jgi:heme exporter protein D
VSLLRHPVINILFISFMSAIYSFIFIFTAGHMEFISILSHSKTLDSDFWNSWSDFLRTGNMKFIGYLIIGLTVVILVFILVKRMKEYDEYQVSILAKSLFVAGFLSIMMIPFLMVMLLSAPNYSTETIILFATVQWLGVLVSYLYFVVRS